MHVCDLFQFLYVTLKFHYSLLSNYRKRGEKRTDPIEQCSVIISNPHKCSPCEFSIGLTINGTCTFLTIEVLTD